jgi:hypothetical protein
MSRVNDPQQQQQVQQGLHSYTAHGLTCSKGTYSFLHLLVLLGKVVHQRDGLFFNDKYWSRGLIQTRSFLLRLGDVHKMTVFENNYYYNLKKDNKD